MEPDPRAEWAGWFRHQGASCEELGSPLYGRLFRLLAGDVERGGATWDAVAPHEMRFGQAGPLRLAGTAHRLALSGAAPGWAAVLPSCGGSPPEGDDDLLDAWSHLLHLHADEVRAGLGRDVQTNEVARGAALALGLAATGVGECDLVELGCSAGLNLRLDHFSVDLGGVVLGDASSAVQLRPELRGDTETLRHAALAVPKVWSRTGIDRAPLDPTRAEDARVLLGFCWPDQAARIDRTTAAIGLAARIPAELRRAPGGPGEPDTPTLLAEVLRARAAESEPARAVVVMQSTMWQYVETDERWRITEVIEEAGAASTAQRRVCWVRHEPDEWDRRRVAVHVRTWPGGHDRLVAHADHHGRWLSTVDPAPARDGSG